MKTLARHMVTCRECDGYGYAPLAADEDAEIGRCGYCDGTGSHPSVRRRRFTIQIADIAPHPLDSDEWLRRMRGGK